MAPNNVFVDASMMHVKVINLRIFREKILFGLSTNYKIKFVRKPILANLGTRVSNIFLRCNTLWFVVPPRQTNTSKLLTAIFIFISPCSFSCSYYHVHFYVHFMKSMISTNDVNQVIKLASRVQISKKVIFPK